MKDTYLANASPTAEPTFLITNLSTITGCLASAGQDSSTLNSHSGVDIPGRHVRRDDLLPLHKRRSSNYLGGVHGSHELGASLDRWFRRWSLRAMHEIPRHHRQLRNLAPQLEREQGRFRLRKRRQTPLHINSAYNLRIIARTKLCLR